MKRRLLNLLTVASLLACAAVVVLWVRSYWIQDTLRFAAHGLDYGAVSIRGRVLLTRDRQDRRHDRPLSWEAQSFPVSFDLGYLIHLPSWRPTVTGVL